MRSGDDPALDYVTGKAAERLMQRLHENILAGWMPKLDSRRPAAGIRLYRRSSLCLRVGDPGWDIYDDPNPAVRLRCELLGKGFPAVAMRSSVW